MHYHTLISSKIRCCSWIVLAVFSTLLLAPQVARGGWVPFSTVDRNGKTFYYQLFVPPNVQAGVQYPLVVALHGAGERTNGNPAPSTSPASWFADAALQASTPHYVLAPWCPTGEQWVDVPWDKGSYDYSTTPISNELQAVFAVVDDLMTPTGGTHQVNINSNRVYCTGLSMGGFGTWYALMYRPQLWAGAIAVCGGASPTHAALIKDIPIWTSHGDADPIVPVSGTREIVSALLGANGNVRYREVAGGGHDVWLLTYRDTESVPWVLQQVKGQVAMGNLPAVAISGAHTLTRDLSGARFNLTGTVSNPTGGLNQVFQYWSSAQGGPAARFLQQYNQLDANVLLPSLGTHRVEMVASDGTLVVKDGINVTITNANLNLPSFRMDFEEGSGAPNDDSGNGTPVTVGSPVYSTSTPNPGSTKSININGTAPSVLVVGHSPALSPDAERKLTVATWVKSNGAWSGAICLKKGSWQLVPGRFTGGDNFGNGNWMDFSSPPTDTWVHVAFVTDTTTTKYYLNGVLTATRPTPVKIEWNTEDLIVGKSVNNQLFNGWLDDFQVYQKALSAAEVATLASAQPPAPAVPAITAQAANQTVTGGTTAPQE